MKVILYHKRHKITGLNYFGKTTRSDPYSYLGSGKRWINHLKKHGKDIETIAIWEFENMCECTEFALTFSRENNIVESSNWANLTEENGKDGLTSAAASKMNRERVEKGTHHLLGGKVTRTQLLNGTHPSQNEKSKEKIREKTIRQIAEGNHAFTGEAGSILSKKVQQQRIANGTHHLLGSSHSFRALSKGIHPSQNLISIEKQRIAAARRIEQGIHPSQTLWACEVCGKAGKGKSNMAQHKNKFCKGKTIDE
jgi:hypothetical protein